MRSGEFSLDIRQKREDVRELERLLEERWNWFSSERPQAAGTWRTCDDLARLYLVSRACDLVRYGEEIAGRTFPEPADPDHRRLVSSLVWLLEETEQRAEHRKEKEEDARERVRIERECAAKVATIYYPPPAVVADRVLSSQERGEVLRACEREFARSEAVETMVGVVMQFAEFCLLLGKPENHIKVRSGQFVEKEVYTRSVADMTNEMVQEMVRLPPFTAYAKLIDGEDGEQRVTVRKIRTLVPPAVLDRESVTARIRTIATNSAAYHKGRDEIEEEIRLRQERWRRPGAESQAPLERQGQRRSARPGGTDAGEADEPPPQFS